VANPDDQNQKPVVAQLIDDAIVAVAQPIRVLKPAQLGCGVGRGSVAKLSISGASRFLISGASFRNCRRATGVSSIR
jgi:hypothetical protein